MALTLRDGSRITIRPIKPEDREELRRGFHRLSEESRYRRFFGPVAELRDRDLDYLTDVDHQDHEALLALDEDGGTGVIGVARYVRTSRAAAEPAMAVIDDWHGRGVGGALLGALVSRALEEGVIRFEAPVLAENHEAVKVLERLGETTVRREGREMILTIDLPAAPADERWWSRLLTQFAVGVVQPARTLLQLIWPHRAGRPDDVRDNLIIVGIDGTEDCEHVLRAAAAVAAPSKATLELVGAYPFLTGHKDELEQALKAGADVLRGQGLETHETVRLGDPSFVLSDIAQERNARLIVVGAGEAGGATRRIIGGHADHVAERAPCSVLIVRPRRFDQAPAEAGSPASGAPPAGSEPLA